MGLAFSLPDFKVLFEAAPALYLVLLPDSPTFTIVAVSDAYLSATMTERSSILGRGIFDVFPDNPADSEATGVRNLRDSLRRVVSGRKPDAMAVQKYDVRRPEAHGGGFEIRYWSPVNCPVLGGGEEVAYIIHRVEDVTDFIRLKEAQMHKERVAEDLRAHAETMEAEVFLRAQQLQESNRQLRLANEELASLRAQESATARDELEKSERRYRTLISATTSIVWTRNAKGEFVGPQPSWSAYTGQSFEQYCGWGWLDALHPEDRDRVRDRWQDVVKSETTFEVEGRIWHAESGAYRYFIGRGAAVIGRSGAIEEWIGTVTDNDERKRLDEQLRHTAKLESLGVLAGGIAHDFNNLLTGILGNASQAMEAFSPRNPTDARLLVHIMEAGERAAHLTRQMLAYSGKGSFQIVDVDLSEQVREISALVQSSVPKHVRLSLDLREGLPCIQADAGQLQQVVMNLIINAAEAIPEQTNGSVIVTTSLQDVDEDYAIDFNPAYAMVTGSYVSLEVQDNGSGMDEETTRKIFDPFFTTKVHGRGLGLSAVLGIVRGHKGALRVDSSPGHGTTFKVLFPAGREKSRSASIPTRVKKTERPCGVLVIDDEELVGKVVKSSLERYGHSVWLAADGPAGIELFRSLAEQVDLVILDLTMPKMTGEETLRRLRTIRPGIPVILSSGYDQVEATRTFMGEGLASFLQKPFTTGQLRQAVEAALQGSSQIQSKALHK